MTTFQPLCRPQQIGTGFAANDPAAQCVVLDSRASCPLHERLCYSVNGEIARIASIVLLFCSGSPLAVVWLIVAIVLNAVKRQASGALAHIGKKVFKFTPALADSDAPAAIVGPEAVSRVTAASQHRTPRRMCGCLDAIRPVAVLSVCQNNNSIVPVKRIL